MKIQHTLLFLLLSNIAFAQKVIQLYEGKPKGSENWTWSEQTSTQNMFNSETVYNVSQPTITAFLPPYYLATGTAVVIAPGGAFHTLSINSEGYDVAKWLNSLGIAAFVLKYRVARSFTDDPVKEIMGKMSNFKALDEENAPIIPLAMADGLAAVKYIRDHAKELEINPNTKFEWRRSMGNRSAMIVDWFVTHKVSSIFVAGGTGEFFSLSKNEYKKIVEVTSETVKEAVPMISSGRSAGDVRAPLTMPTQEEVAELERIIQKGNALLA